MVVNQVSYKRGYDLKTFLMFKFETKTTNFEHVRALALTAFLLSFISSSSCFIAFNSLAVNKKKGTEK